MKLTIARSLLIFGLIVGAGLMTAIATQNHAFDRLKVNGPVYEQVIYGKDLVADILPPPLFLVEAYSLATEGAYHADLAATNLTKIANLKKGYLERKAYWPVTGLAADLKAQLTERVQPSADAFWSIIEGDYAKAIAAGDDAAMRAATMELRDAFGRHQSEVVKLVDAANLFLAAAEKQAAEETRMWSTLSYTAAGLALALLACGLVMMHRRAIVPLRGMQTYMSVLARGDYAQPVPYEGRADEIGEMADAVTIFRQNAQERIATRLRQEADREQTLAAERAEQARKSEEDATRSKVIDVLGRGLDQLSRGNLTARITDRFPADYESLRQQFNDSVQSLEEALAAISDTTEAVRLGAESISGGTDQLSRRTETQAASLEEAASALTQITANVRSTADRAREANTRMTDTRRSAEQSTGIVLEAVSAMARIEQSSNQIRQIIAVIDEIAFQTNLLALNAGVEAARAGDAGKGFAVVAQEVRELAGRSAQASREIRQLIDASSKEVGDGVSLVNRTGSALSAIEEQVNQVNQLIAAIVNAAGEQSHALVEISEAVNQMDGVTQKNAAMAEEANAACSDLNGYTESLARNIARFRLGASQAAAPSLRMAS